MAELKQPGAVSYAIAHQAIRMETSDSATGSAQSSNSGIAGASGTGLPSVPKRRRGNGRRVRKNNRVSSVLQSRMLKTKLCRWMSQGRCEKGAECSFAHSEAELRACPDLTKTRMCASFEQRGVCGAGEKCRFAHTEDELRGTEEFYRTALCEDWMKGCCKLKERCRFAHGEEHLHQKPPIDEIATKSRVESDLNAAIAASSGPNGQTPSADAEASIKSMSVAATVASVGGGLGSPSSCKDTATRGSSRSSTASWESGTDSPAFEDLHRWWATELLNAMINELTLSVEAACIRGELVVPTALQACLFEILGKCVSGSLELSDSDIRCLELFYSIHKRLQSVDPSMLQSIDATTLLDPRFFC
eukprot:Gregarina_sp_Poly_1__8995@NODE_547_length_7572_cov_311_443438_g434_i0_p2_GENE_NODE_547_length_7572_cov_311_443438_g434_i0NODE_547_length_7572_cov_311_443438_g434_i0_p2_ORF_typecomplete_len361_score41_37zfCCCH/PF00642_24/1_4e06zfCCCH/PF00642_24/3_6e06zfCCCH/PF00642_24/1_4e05zfCCCH_3/PF15663_5/3_1e07zfCCCH_3/PF15663_5/6e07Torus/PF16131_5/0_0026Torus/PF16131_5/0_16Torus/PF16131_5/0_91zfCCCH_4/PF18044_1/0_92zfCCCH_4/PF18044_1/0_084zfCCCH_4/PF18044_1/0_017zf_CCCH_4/PF18345_1/0_0074zf_CCCH_4/PF18345_1